MITYVDDKHRAEKARKTLRETEKGMRTGGLFEARIIGRAHDPASCETFCFADIGLQGH